MMKNPFRRISQPDTVLPKAGDVFIRRGFTTSSLFYVLDIYDSPDGVFVSYQTEYTKEGVVVSVETDVIGVQGCIFLKKINRERGLNQ